MRGLFLGRRADRDWFLDGLSRFYPDAHRRWLEALPEHHRNDPLAGYRDRLDDRDRRVRLTAGEAWTRYESACSSLAGGGSFGASEAAWRMARCEVHYLANNCFFDDPNLGALSCVPAGGFDFPGVLVHGRFDMICPISGAFALRQRWSALDLQVVQQAGHSAAEPAITEALTTAVEVAKSW